MLNSGAAASAPVDIGNVVVFDSAGIAHTISLKLTNNATVTPGSWLLEVREGADKVLASGEIRFNADGTPAPGFNSINISLAPEGITATDIELNFGDPGSTAGVRSIAAAASTVQLASQDGFAVGSLTRATFDDQGFLSLSYSNGQTLKGERLALASFTSLQDLQPVEGNLFEPRDDQAPALGVAGESMFGAVAPGRVELSNVELSQEFGNLIISQRGYQASSQVDQYRERDGAAAVRHQGAALMEWRPFKLLNASERTWLARTVRGAVGEWFAAWLPSTPAGAVRCFDPIDRAATRLAAEPTRWLGFTHRDATVSVALGPELERRLAEGLLGAERRSALVDDVTIAALHDLAGRLLLAGAAAPALAHEPPGDPCWRRGSGAAIVEVDLGAQVLALLVSPAWVAQQLAARPRAKPPPRAELADPSRCIARARVSLQAWAGKASVEIGVLQTLAPGDVIWLDARIDQPLPVSVQGRESGRSAYLGSVEGRRAVQIAPR